MKQKLNYEISDTGCNQIITAVMVQTLKQLRDIEANCSSEMRIARYKRYEAERGMLREKLKTCANQKARKKIYQRITILSRKMRDLKNGKERLKKIAFLNFVKSWANKDNPWCRAFSEIRNIDIDLIINKLQAEAQRKIEIIISN